MTAILNGIEQLGADVCAGFGWVFTLLFRILRLPFVGIVKAVFGIRDFAVSSFRRVVGDEKFFTGRAVRAVKGVGYALRRSPKSVPSVVAYYVKRSFARYGGLARYLLLLAVPAAAAVLFFGVFFHFRALTPAYLLTASDGSVVGCVQDESEYLLARAAARRVLEDGGEAGDVSFPEVRLTPALVRRNRFTGLQALSDTLLSLSDAKVTDACGVYIDGAFLCAVKSETEARAVFDRLLRSLSEGAEGVSAFVQNITLTQGVYPESAVASAETLNSLVSAVGADAYYTADREMTVAEAAADLALSEEAFLLLNPDYTAEDTVPAGANLLAAKGEGPLTVKTVVAEVETVDKPYETVEIKSDSLYVGTDRVVVDGEKGKEQITNLVTYIGGERVASEEISRLTLKEPVSQTLQVGTRALDSSYVVATSFGGILLWPAVGCDRINSDYGYRWGKLHSAIDIGSSVGTSYGKTVVAAAKGTVVIAGVHSSYGYYVKIDHGNGMQTLYAHCMAGSLMVYPGQQVIAGQPIARVGATGYATGPHLHFEVIMNGVRVDPKPYLGLKR